MMKTRYAELAGFDPDDGSDAVSYTHLDVYKRQVYDGCPFAAERVLRAFARAAGRRL